MTQILNDLRIGEETKLSERFMGKQIYAKLINFGAMPAAGEEKAVAHGITGMDQFGIDYGRSYVNQGNGNRHALTYPNAVANGFWRTKVNETEVAIQSGQDRSAFTAVICAWYTKADELPGTEPDTKAEIEELKNKVAALETQSGTAMRTWESDWFNIAPRGAYDLTHALSLETPWRCMPRVVARVKKAAAGWTPGEIVFGDGSNYVGATADCETGWAIAISKDSAHLTFGNSPLLVGNLRNGGGHSSGLPKVNVECKLLISY